MTTSVRIELVEALREGHLQPVHGEHAEDFVARLERVCPGIVQRVGERNTPVVPSWASALYHLAHGDLGDRALDALLSTVAARDADWHAALGSYWRVAPGFGEKRPPWRVITQRIFTAPANTLRALATIAQVADFLEPGEYDRFDEVRGKYLWPDYGK